MKELIKECLKDFREDMVDLIAENIAYKIEVSGFLVKNHYIDLEKLPDELKEKVDFSVIQNNVLNHPDKEQFSDGYHTFEELYNFRKIYNATLFNEWAGDYNYAKGINNVAYDVHKSWRHNDGELCFGGGWFIVVAVLPTGQISNHYEAKDWDLFRIPETPTAKYEWDGHETKDVLKRLMEL